ncbi:hypothetical protein [uncultured Pontibacter sp.]|uniref:hypothetical protein n=1 Tax=uncultured Pontibacter sp. TaxID=453356 RepID=UPI0026064171|nr:hypothetical protein [uncultured Pontibacter sp.]
MKIYEFCPFYKEQLIADIHIEESKKWVDEIHITEANRTFQYLPKDFLFVNTKGAVHHKVNVDKLFKPNRKLIPNIVLNKSRSCKSIFRNPAWFNDATQRNLAASFVDFDDEDIIILSDIDEIIDPVHADRIVEEVKKRKIMTVKIHFTLFYFNLFSKNWSGPADYSYRICVIKGHEFRKKWKKDSDWLRKLGEGGKLTNEVYCPDKFMGFHHSWLGDENFISEKLNAYAHTEHREHNDLAHIKSCLKEGKSIFPGHELEVNNSIKLLDAVEQYRRTSLFL